MAVAVWVILRALKNKLKEYGHDALVTKVTAELPHNNIAYERFTPQGPMALLPNGNDKNSCEFSLVWTGLQANIHAVSGLDDLTFLKQLHEAFGDRVGAFLSVEKRLCFPLKLSTLKTFHCVTFSNYWQRRANYAPSGGARF